MRPIKMVSRNYLQFFGNELAERSVENAKWNIWKIELQLLDF